MPIKATYKELEQKINELECKTIKYEQAGKVFEKTEAKYKSLFENDRAATVILEDDITISMANPEFESLSGYSRREIEGKMKWTEFVVPKDLERIKRYHRERRESGKTPPSEYEFLFLNRAGDIRDIYVKVGMIPGTRKSVASLLDITELKQSEEILRESRKHFRDLAEMLPEAVFVADKNMNLTFANQKAFKMFGYTRQDLRKGLNGFKMLVVEDRARARENAINRFQNNGLGAKEYHGLRKDGSSFPVLLHTSPIITQNIVTGYRGIIVDISERKKAEEALQKVNEELVLLTEQLRRLTMKLMVAERIEQNRIARILHDDIQQLLAGAKINLQLYKETVRPDQHDNIDTSIELITESLKISRSLTEELVPKALGQKDLGEIIKWLCGFMRRTHNLEVDLTLCGNLEVADENIRLFLYQSVRELLFNVVKHSGTISARVAVEKDSSGNLQVKVIDYGCGFDDSLIKKGKELEGHFGLFSIRERLSLLKGDLELESTRGKGTSCTIKMPLKGIESFEEAAKSCFEKVPVIGMPKDCESEIRLLLIHDQKAMREGFAELLNKEPDINVVGQTGTGQKAIGMALDLLPDVVLMVIRKPELDSIKNIRTITKVMPGVRIVGLSPDESKPAAEDFLSAGVAVVLSKNCGAEDVLQEIRKHGGKR